MRTPEQTLAHLDEIATRADSASHGPWREGAREGDCIAADAGIGFVVLRATNQGTIPSSSDHAFIVNAREDVPDLVALVRHLVAERDAYKRAKAENDERFMLERDEARAKRDEALRALRAVLPYAEWCAEGLDAQAVEIKNAEDARAAAGIAIQHALKRSRLAREAARAAAAAVDAAKRADPDLKLQNVAPDWSTVVLGTTPLHRFLSDARAVANRAAHERPLPNTNEPEDQHVPHAEAEDEP